MVQRANEEIVWGGVLKGDVARFLTYALQAQVQRRSFELAIGRVGGKKAICVFPAPFRSCAFVRDFQYAEENEYDQYKQACRRFLALQI